MFSTLSLMMVAAVLGGVLNGQEYTYLNNVLNDLNCRNNSRCPLKNLTMADDWTNTTIMNVTNGAVYSLTLHANGLTGMMSTWLGKLTHLTQLTIAAQALNKQPNIIPTQLALLTDLASINIHAVRLVGTVPNILAAAWPKLTSLKIFGNSLTGTVPYFPHIARRYLCTLVGVDARGNCLDVANSPNCDVPNGGMCQCNQSWAICPNGTTTIVPSSSLTSILTTTTTTTKAVTKTSSTSTSTTNKVSASTTTTTASSSSSIIGDTSTTSTSSSTDTAVSSFATQLSDLSVSANGSSAAIGETTSSAPTDQLANTMILLVASVMFVSTTV